MPSKRSLGRATAAVLAGLALSTTAAVSAGTAAASVETAASLCNVNQNTWVRALPGFSEVLYTIPAGGGFRIGGVEPAWSDGLWWWYGRGNGGQLGWVPDQNLTNCH